MLKKRHSIDALFVMLLYGLYTLLSLLMVLTGTRVYKGIMEKSAERGGARVALYYTANKIRSGDVAGSLRVGKFEGEGVVTDAVVIESASVYYEGVTTQTIIYEYDGVLRELFKYDYEDFYPSLGMEIIAVGGFRVTEAGGVFTIEVTSPDGSVREMNVTCRSQ